MNSSTKTSGRNRSLAVCAAMVLACSWAAPAVANSYTYQIDNATNAGECCFQNSLYGEAEDSWVGNTFTAIPNFTHLTSVTWETGLMENLPAGGKVTYAIYSGTPSTGLTLLEQTSVPYAGMPDQTFITQSLPTPINLTAGQNFTAALLIDNTPSNSFPFSIDNSNLSTNGSHGSYYDIVSTPANQYGLTNAYTIGSPYFPVLNGANYIFAPARSQAPTLGRPTRSPGLPSCVSTALYTPEPSSLMLVGVAGVMAVAFGLRRRLAG